MSAVPVPQKHKLTVEIAEDAYEIMEKLRGGFSQDSFIELVLRMIDSDAVKCPPHYAPTGSTDPSKKPDEK